MSDEYTNKQIAWDIAKDIWAGLKLSDIGAIVWPVVFLCLSMPKTAVGFALFFGVLALLDAAFWKTNAKTVGEQWTVAHKRWGDAVNLSRELAEDRIADMWFHVCMYTNFLQAPHEVPRWIAEAQRLYAEEHVVN